MYNRFIEMNTNINLTLDFAVAADEFSEAAVNNPFITWAKAIICDDKPNANNERIPVEEFDNMIRSGIYSPVKMAEEITGHQDALGKPIGTITNLMKSGNQLKALIALWTLERQEAVATLQEMVADGNLPQLSWEIAFSEVEENSDGVKDLHGVVLNGAAVVRQPAYKGRTPIYATAEDINPEGNNLDELEQVKAQLAEALEKIEQLSSNAETISTELDSLKSERDQLLQFKQSVEMASAELEKLASIKAKFVEAGISKDDNYFEDNRNVLLKLEEAELDFFIQNLIAFKNSEASVKSQNGSLPNVGTDNDSVLIKDPRELAKALRNALRS